MGFMSEALSFTTADLAERDAALLDFEDSWYTSSVPKDQAIICLLYTSPSPRDS